MKKITIEQIEQAQKESKKADGVVHIVISCEEIKLWITGASINTVKNSGIEYLCTVYSKDDLFDCMCAFGEKKDFYKGENLAERINLYLIEKGYELN